jgi:hypothetical protein
MSPVIQQHVNELLNNIKFIKVSEKYKDAKNADKSSMLYTVLALCLAYQRTPIPSDTDIIIRQHYLMVVKPLCEEVLAAVNEEEYIDYNKVLELIEPLYMTRYNIAHGHTDLKTTCMLVEASTMISGEHKAYMEGALDAFK